MRHYSPWVWTFRDAPYGKGWIGAPATYRSARLVRRPQPHTDARVAILPGVIMPTCLLRYGRQSRTTGLHAFVARMRIR